MKKNLIFLSIGILFVLIGIIFLEFNLLNHDDSKKFEGENLSIEESQVVVEEYIKELYPYKFLNGTDLMQIGKGVYKGNSNYSFKYKLEVDSQYNSDGKEIAEIEVFIEKGDIKNIIYSEELVIKKDRTYCTKEQRNTDACIMVYDPVCGYKENKPCETYSNDCVACRDIEVVYYTPGECL